MKLINKSVVLAAVILTTVVNTGCTSMQERYEVSGKNITVERKSTNRAYIDQVKLTDDNGESTLSGSVTWQTSTRGVLSGKFYIDLIDNHNNIVKKIEKEHNRPSPAIRQVSFELELGDLPDSVSKIAISYGD